jgi:hypothetical protein
MKRTRRGLMIGAACTSASSALVLGIIYSLARMAFG